MVETLLPNNAESKLQFQKTVETLFKSLREYGQRYEWDEAITVLKTLRELLNNDGEKIEFLKRKIDSVIGYVENVKKVAL